MIVFEPKVADCKPGLYCYLKNGWIVGPIVSTNYPDVYVQYTVPDENNHGQWTVDVSDDSREWFSLNRIPNYKQSLPRYVLAVGTKKELLKLLNTDYAI